MRILLVKSSSMGDIVHALPAAQDIRAAMPDARIDWVAEESFAEIPALSPCVSEVIVTAFRRWRRSLLSAQTWREVRAVRRKLRENHYDAVIDLQGLVRSGLVTSWARAPSWGLSADTVREPLAARFYDHALAVPESLTPVRRCRVLCARALGYEIDENRPHWGLRRDLPSSVEPGGPYVCLAVNTSREEKLWPRARWTELGCRLRAQGLRSVLFWGSGAERERCREIASGVPDALVLERRLRLAEIAGVLVRSQGLVGVDTGITHLAAACGIASVGVIVGTSAALFSLVSEGPCATVGDAGEVPSVDAVHEAFLRVTQ